MRNISKQELKEKIDRGDPFALVEVLSPEEFAKFHLPDAINVPLNDDFAENMQQMLPDKRQEVVVYCKDEECPASPKAAKQLEQLGYQRVADYAGGKEDWRKAS
jgi:rhodanese-related sulfurtransferase